MRKLRLFEHISLDGIVQPYRTPAGREAVLAAYGDGFDLLLGRRTYDLWSGFWPSAPSSPMAERLNRATKYVATRRPESLGWGPAESLGPDLIEGVRRVKAEKGPALILTGSSTLTSMLLAHGLADELVLISYPLLLGTGKRFFAERTPARAFNLLSPQAVPSGIILHPSGLAGLLRTG